MRRKDPYGRALRAHEYYRKNDGRYLFRIKTTYGKNIDIYSSTLQGLRDKVDEYFKAVYNGIDITTAHSVTLNQLFFEYMNFKTELKASTKDNYIYMWTHFIEGTLGKAKVKDINYSDVSGFYYYLLEERGLQINTLANIHTLLHPVLDVAVRNNIVPRNVSDGVYSDFAKKYKHTKKTKSRLSISEQAIFTELLNRPDMNYSWRIIFTTMLHTGCRAGEIIGLRWSDVDFSNKAILINHNVRYMKNKETKTFEFHISTPKTKAGNRTIPMTNTVFDILSNEWERQKKHGTCKVSIDGYTDFVFYNQNGNLHNNTTLNRTLKRIVKSYNSAEKIAAKLEHREVVLLSPVSCHTLRHTFASRLCENVTNLKFIQTIMGHSDVTTTMNLYADFGFEIMQMNITNLDSRSVFDPTFKIAV